MLILFLTFLVCLFVCLPMDGWTERIDKTPFFIGLRWLGGFQTANVLAHWNILSWVGFRRLLSLWGVVNLLGLI